MNREMRRQVQRMEGRKPHMVRVNKDPMGLALYNATALTPKEVGAAVGRIRQSFDALRRGEATYRQMACLCTAAELSLSIEQMGVVKGLQQQLDATSAVILTLLGAAKRAAKASPDGWKSPVCTGAQIAQIDEFIPLHKFQLEQISYGEYQRAWQMTIGRTRSKGGDVLKAEPTHRKDQP